MAIGVPAAFALDRLNFPGKTLFRRLVLLPLVLPGIITGIAMLNLFKLMGFRLSLETVIIGHATALLSVVVTQVFARLQRLNRNLEEAAADLGAKPWETFFYIVLPNIRSAIIGSALLSFTLSFDEIPVTFFLTGPRQHIADVYLVHDAARDHAGDQRSRNTDHRGITRAHRSVGLDVAQQRR